VILKQKQASVLKTVLLALIPYTKQNLQLVFKPNLFFDELEKTSGLPKQSIRLSYRHAFNKKIIRIENGQIKLSLKARQIIQPFIAKKLNKDAQLMIIFDIPEQYAGRRQRLRNLLKQLDFKQIQLSVWSTNMDYREIIFESIAEIRIKKWVELYESAKIPS